MFGKKLDVGTREVLVEMCLTVTFKFFVITFKYQVITLECKVIMKNLKETVKRNSTILSNLHVHRGPIFP